MKNTLSHMFQATVRDHGDRPAFKTRAGDGCQTVSYRELHQRALALATAIAHRGVGFQDHVGLISDNRLEWILSDLACLMAGAADVPRGSDSTAAEIEFVLVHSDAVAVFVEDARQLAKVLAVDGLVSRLGFIAVMDPRFSGSEHPKVCSLESLEAEGRALLEAGDGAVANRLEKLQPDHAATIIYTSGTTGEPKGVVLLHRNIMHNVRVTPNLLGMTCEDRWLSVLPPWHIFERTAEYLVIRTGGSTAYTSIKNFAQDMKAEHPTFIASVPRIWEGVYGKVMAAMEKEAPLKRSVFLLLLAVSKRFVRASRVVTGEAAVFKRETPPARLLALARSTLTLAALFLPYRFAQKKFAAIRDRTGGCLRAAISGGGALPHYVDEFFAAVGLTLLEGYGLTETSPVIAVRRFDRRVMGTVGPLVPETEVKVVDSAGRELAPGNKGIIRVRGELVMKGYYKRDDLTAAAIDGEGWLDTGDLGVMTPNGELAIVGREKETIVLRGGENVEPTPIEDRITESRFIAQVMVVGQDQKVLGALVVPEMEAVREHLDRLGVPAEGPSPAAEAVRELMRAEISRLVSGETGFKPFERIARVGVLDEEFRVGEELTHTLKKKRNVITAKHAELIDELFR